MRWLRKLENSLAPLAVPYTTPAVILGQVLFYGIGRSNPDKIDQMTLQWDAVLQGEWWRLVTFIFYPPATNPIFVMFGWYLFWLMGTALEQLWGTLRYNVYLAVACIATAAVAYFSPDQPMTNGYIGLSVFLAFAFLHPNFEFLVMFILPVKVKYLAIASWFWIVVVVTTREISEQLAAAASVLNFMLFFGKDVVMMVLRGRRRLHSKMQTVVDINKPFHRCHTCGITDKSHPTMDFRYCPDCDGSPGYCTEHITRHKHVRTTIAERNDR